MSCFSVRGRINNFIFSQMLTAARWDMLDVTQKCQWVQFITDFEDDQSNSAASSDQHVDSSCSWCRSPRLQQVIKSKVFDFGDIFWTNNPTAVLRILVSNCSLLFDGIQKTAFRRSTVLSPDDNALLQKRTRIASFWPIVHTDPENTLFWNRVSGWRNLKTQPSRFHTIAPPLDLWPLNPVTSHNNNNNNGGLHARVLAAEDIQPFLQLTLLVVECEWQQQFDLINGPHQRFRFLCTRH